LTTRLLSIGSKKPEVFEPLKAHQSPKDAMADAVERLKAGFEQFKADVYE